MSSNNFTTLETIALILSQARAAKKLLLREVGAAVAIDPSMISKYEKGERLPTRAQIHRFAQFYSLDESELMISYLSDKMLQEIGKFGQPEQVLQATWQKLKDSKRTK